VAERLSGKIDVANVVRPIVTRTGSEPKPRARFPNRSRISLAAARGTLTKCHAAVSLGYSHTSSVIVHVFPSMTLLYTIELTQSDPCVTNERVLSRPQRREIVMYTLRYLKGVFGRSNGRSHFILQPEDRSLSVSYPPRENIVRLLRKHFGPDCTVHPFSGQAVWENALILVIPPRTTTKERIALFHDLVKILPVPRPKSVA
jgi:hypothetical protein